MRQRIVVVVGALALGGCSSQAALQPAAGTVPATVAQAESQQGVLITALSQPVIGPGATKRRVTPLRVSLHNASQTPIRIRYADLVLVVGEGEAEYIALPVDRFAGPAQPPAEQSWSELPALEANGLRVEQASNASPSARDPSRPGPDEYSNYGPEPGRVVLPTRAMIEAAIPEGTLEPGGTVTGYLYFAPVTEPEERVVLRARFTPVPQADPATQVLLPVRTLRGR